MHNLVYKGPIKMQNHALVVLNQFDIKLANYVVKITNITLVNINFEKERTRRRTCQC